MKYAVYTTPVINRYLYAPMLGAVMNTARLMRRFQTGSVHLYIAYIFVTLVILILFL
jgi:hydrogenase-4 component B